MTSERSRREGGFTLVEVLVALVIFGVIAASVLKTMQDSVRHQALMEERLAASWIAQQALAEIRLQEDWPPLGEKTERVPQGAREWQVTARVESTNEERLRHIIIEVAEPDSETPSLTLDAWAARGVTTAGAGNAPSGGRRQ
ncbi:MULTISPECIES: type II secretion system minor pseudopilin GspI [Microbulbifer]|uniref:type II secretion system minor pseudopilin GspI n=1 Tax=Microbulbifer TaxID=48073 RepID=UPI001E436F0B|nr:MULTISPECIES: type II secretion system minor pseudopilin GspI [Microbulbifer]UHQ55749.1 type II secretion system minor pseudopilin GspI [Microbulbifer sp. YPW16]